MNVKWRRTCYHLTFQNGQKDSSVLPAVQLACRDERGDYKKFALCNFRKNGDGDSPAGTNVSYSCFVSPYHRTNLLYCRAYCTKQECSELCQYYLSVKRVDHPHATSHAPLCWYFTGHFKSSVLHFPITLLLLLWQLFSPIFYLFNLCSFVSSIEATQAYHLCAMQLQ